MFAGLQQSKDISPTRLPWHTDKDQHISFIRVEEEWQHDGQVKEQMCTNVISLFSPAIRCYFPQGLLHLHHMGSSTFPKKQKENLWNQEKYHSGLCTSPDHSPNILLSQCFFLFCFVFFMSCQISREDVTLWMIYKAVCISFSWHWSTHVISAHFLLQSCFIQCKGARFLLQITLMSQQKIPSRPQRWNENARHLCPLFYKLYTDVE